ncbi:MAG: aminotransferase class V-fold PLP-dependent enzyme [Planctomycetes bacterium]|nr:aminotransferase class V-fold PLP-dependent enzyme [Planctomycetota bacterium]
MTDLYFDHAASTPVIDEALAAFKTVHQTHFANPSAAHHFARDAHAVYSESKNTILDLMGCSDGQLIHCATASEANNLAMHHALAAGGRVAIAADVHASIWSANETYANRCDIIPLSDDGRITIESLLKVIGQDTALICISHVCHETGVIHDVQKLAAWCERKDIACLIDGAQAVGKLKVQIDDIAATYYTFSAHKFGGLRGSAGLLWRAGTGTGKTLISGGGQEYGIRAGTENIAALAATSVALERILENCATNHSQVSQLRTYCLDALRSLQPLENTSSTQLPHILSLSFVGVAASTLVEDLSVTGIAVANGSACNSHQLAPSRIILALGRSESEALGTLRISFSAKTTESSIDILVEKIKAAIDRHRL